METKNKVWLVTGASKGLGLVLVKKLLAEGYQVAATSRNKEELSKAVDNNTAFFLPLQVDLMNEQSIQNAMATLVSTFGCIDVVVNNAGYGIGGTLEELTSIEILQSFEVNVLATINVIKAVIPHFRAQRSGHIINISSIAGFSAGIGWGVYAATKFALVGLSEVLADEVKEFGVHVTVVQPGAFRTQFLSAESLVMTKTPIEDYTKVRETHTKYLQMNGLQTGDPEKAASVFIALAENPNPPVRLFLGSDAYQRAMQKIEVLQQDLAISKEISLSTDFDN
jgi:NAD(P)-dependent dehydrogenase (short-subunit alcohol dehydrogenase family)